MEGKLVIISAPSGAGKTTLVRYLLSQVRGLAFSVSACSRQKRPHEVEGRDYYFISPGEFREKIARDEFVEWEEVYRGRFYGTLKSEIERIWSMGLNVIFDVDVIGGMNIKKKYGGRALAIFIMPPSIEELEKRLVRRSTESTGELKKRLVKAESEIRYAPEFDVTIVNEDLDRAKVEALMAVKNFLETPDNIIQ